MLVLNEKIQQRAQTFLAPGQVAELKNLQQDQLEKARMVVRMTNALFGRRNQP
jgi:hypothetical protein